MWIRTWVRPRRKVRTSGRTRGRHEDMREGKSMREDKGEGGVVGKGEVKVEIIREDKGEGNK